MAYGRLLERRYLVDEGWPNGILAFFHAIQACAYPPGLPRGAYRSPKNLRTRADLRARTRKSGSENTT